MQCCVGFKIRSSSAQVHLNGESSGSLRVRSQGRVFPTGRPTSRDGQGSAWLAVLMRDIFTANSNSLSMLTVAREALEVNRILLLASDVNIRPASKAFPSRLRYLKGSVNIIWPNSPKQALAPSLCGFGF